MAWANVVISTVDNGAHVWALGAQGEAESSKLIESSPSLCSAIRSCLQYVVGTQRMADDSDLSQDILDELCQCPGDSAEDGSDIEEEPPMAHRHP